VAKGKGKKFQFKTTEDVVFGTTPKVLDVVGIKRKKK
jgi:hypothetical protein